MLCSYCVSRVRKDDRILADKTVEVEQAAQVWAHVTYILKSYTHTYKPACLNEHFFSNGLSRWLALAVLLKFVPKQCLDACMNMIASDFPVPMPP